MLPSIDTLGVETDILSGGDVICMLIAAFISRFIAFDIPPPGEGFSITTG